MFDLLWITDPTAWVGLFTLVVIEIVLGIDNLVFIAIMSAKLPMRIRDKARYTGLGGALVIRLALLTVMSYMVHLTEPLFSVGDYACSARDLVMLGGGAFLLYKSTMELHGKLEGLGPEIAPSRAGGHAFGLVVAQIMVLDAVFSIDSIITAVGMVDHVFIMMFAVIIAMSVMIWASKAITEFINSHPTLVILCLGFLLMIGFSLLMEAFHYPVPKGYLYAAIGFSILIECFNQIARRNTLRLGKGAGAMQSRELAANLVLRLLGVQERDVQSLKEAIVSTTGEGVFNTQEQEMVSRVLQLSSIPLKAVMTARNDLEMIDLDLPAAELSAAASACEHGMLIAYRAGARDQPIGYVSRAGLLSCLIAGRQPGKELVHEALMLPETLNLLRGLDELKRRQDKLAFVVDEFGNFEGVATLHDLLEEVAGDLPEPSEMPEITRVAPRCYRIDGEAVLNDVERTTGFHVAPSEFYHTLAGFILDLVQRVPEQGETIDLPGWRIELLEVGQNTVTTVRLTDLRRG
ncbi:MAG: hypothetical protein K6A65_01665 [Succinivibrionaceae bacterium]|nr:hypothetical protein [Succinivibrionaceae bacterium]